MAAETDYVVAITNIKARITRQRNQAVMRYKLFTQMTQGSQPFSTWWSKVREQADRCTFSNYDTEKACKDAILFQKSDIS